MLNRLFSKTDDKNAKKLYLLGILPILAGMGGTYYDLTYHNTHVVDSFFQPAHLIIYSNIFLALIIGTIIAVKTGFKSMMIASAMLLSFGYGDLLFHTAFGFDSFLSPPHLSLLSTVTIQSGIMLRKFIQIDYKPGSIISLACLWLVVAYLLLAFSFVSNRNSDTSYYVIAPQPIVFMVTAFFFSALSVLITKLASYAKVKMLHVALIYSITVLIGAILTNPNLTYTLPLFLIGGLVPPLIYDRRPKFGAVAFGSAWILTYTPYAYKLITYSVSKEAISLNSSYLLIPALGPYYPLMISLGIISAIVTSHFLTERRIAYLLKLRKDKKLQPMQSTGATT
jgi:hypothetical protein